MTREPRGPHQPQIAQALRILTLVMMMAFSARAVASPHARASKNPDTKDVLVGSEFDFPPFMIVDHEGKATGFAVELLRASLKKVNLKPRFEVATWSVLREKLAVGGIDVIPVMAKSPERMKDFEFSEAHSIGYDSIFVRDADTSIKSEADLKGKTIIVQKGDFADDWLKARSREHFEKTGKDLYTFVYSSSPSESFKILLAHGGDAYVGSQLTALITLQKFDSVSVRLTEKPMMSGYSREYSFAVQKGNRDLLNKLNEGLKSVIAGGEYNRVYDKWFSELDPAVREREMKARTMMKLAIGFGIASFTALAALAMVVVFRREVNRKTRSLAESELQFRNLVTSLPGVVFSAEISEAGVRITYISDFVDKLTGYPAETFLGSRLQPLLEIIQPSDRDAVDSAVSENYLNMRRTEIDFRLIRKDGAVRWIQARASAPSESPNGGRLIVNGIFFDITETKTISELLSQQQTKMAATARLSALGEMAGGIAHEINNPLAIINLRAHQLVQLARKGPVKPDDANMVANGIETTAHRISKIVRSLQKVSRESEGDPFEIVPICEIIDETFELCYQRMLNNGIKVVLEDFPRELSIECRRIQISQVLINILNNAFDAVVGRAVKSVRMNVVDLGDRIEIAIANSGPPIPPELAHKIFQPFFTTKGVGKGTGLGLSISKGLIESHGGEISLDLHTPEARFLITLPKRQRKSGVISQAPQRPKENSPSPIEN